MEQAEKKKSSFTFLKVICLIFVVSAVLSALGVFDSSPRSEVVPLQTNERASSPTQNTNPIIAAPKPVEVKTYAIGDSFQAGDFNWQITKVTTASQIGEEFSGALLGKKADGIFLIVSVEIENTGSSAKLLSNSFMRLVDDRGREFSPDAGAAIWLKPQGSALMFEQINPGIVKKGKIVFDVPVGLKVANIRISSNLMQDSISNVRLII